MSRARCRLQKRAAPGRPSCDAEIVVILLSRRSSPTQLGLLSFRRLGCRARRALALLISAAITRISRTVQIKHYYESPRL